MAVDQNIPLFFRLYHKIKHDIITGDLEKGSKINTIEELARQHGVSHASIRKSLELLEREGLLNIKHGWGTVVPENVDLRLFDLGVIIISKNTLPEVHKATIDVFSADWVEAGSRINKLLGLKATSSKTSLYKMYVRLAFKGKFAFKALVTYYFTEQWMRKVLLEKNTPHRETIVSLAQWMESTPLKISESLLPYLCTGEEADLLGLPDGTPVFHQTVVLTGKKDKEPSLCWDMISSANTFVRELEIN
jgi:GntR family transcriptional regulator